MVLTPLHIPKVFHLQQLTQSQSKDSSATYLHMHQPELADLIEEFTKPHTSAAAASSNSSNNHTHTQPPTTHQSSTNPNATTTYPSSSSPSTIPSYLPIEDIYLQPQYQPPNPEDEDDVVPDQHAAFGIARAMERRREAVWRDLGLEALVNGQGHGGGVVAANAAGAGGVGTGATLRGNGVGAASAASAAVRVRSAGRRMGGRRVVTLR
jgi:hypothetical protein